MIELTDLNGRSFYVNPRWVEVILPNRGNAEVIMNSGKNVSVRPSAEEVAKLIQEWEAAHA